MQIRRGIVSKFSSVPPEKAELFSAVQRTLTCPVDLLTIQNLHKKEIIRSLTDTFPLRNPEGPNN